MLGCSWPLSKAVGTVFMALIEGGGHVFVKTPADLLENWSLSWQGVGLAESALGDPWVSRASGHWVDREFVAEIIPVLNRRAGK